MSKDNVIYVSDKELRRYMGSVLHNLEENDSCYLVSRGRDYNAKAIDVAEIVKRDNENYYIESINLSTSEYNCDDGESSKVTELEIEFGKKE